MLNTTKEPVTDVPERRVPPEIEQVLNNIVNLFRTKNNGYAKFTREWYDNFTTNLPVNSGAMTPIVYAMTLAAKQDAAAWVHIDQIREPLTDAKKADLAERLMDGAVYRIIILALLMEGFN